MGKVNLSGGGVRSNVQARSNLATDSLYIYSAIANQVEPCGTGEEADGICLDAVAEGELLNAVGVCHSRKETGVYQDVEIFSNFTAGDEFQSDANGRIVDYTYNASADIRALGKFLTTGITGATGKVLLYSK